MARNKICIFAVLIMAIMCVSTPVFAETLAPTNSTMIQQNADQDTVNPEATVTQEQVDNITSDANKGGSNLGSGVQPVSPSVLTGKMNNLVGQAHAAGKPIMVRISQVMMAVVAFMLVLSIFLGGKMLQKSFFVMFCIGLGLFIYINAGTLTGMVVWLSDYMGR